jgi:transcriptional activator SPT7
VRKRARLSVPRASHAVELWWDAQSSDLFIANSLPPLPSFAASGPAPPPSPSKSQDQPTSSVKTKRRKKRPPRPVPPRPRSLLAMMNANISTQRRMRRTHAKFVAISAAAAAANNAGGEDGEGGDVPTVGPLAGLAGDMDGADDAEADAVDERSWPVPRPSRKSVLDGPVDAKPDIGELAAEKCIHWVNRKVLEHIGFQGTFILPSHAGYSHRRKMPGSSQLSLDVLSGITAEYLSNVGRTFRFYLDKYSNTMTSEVCQEASFSQPCKWRTHMACRKLFCMPSSRAASPEYKVWRSILPMMSCDMGTA